MLSLLYIHLIFFHQPEHKLQSSEGPPQVKLSPVPKMLSVLIQPVGSSSLRCLLQTGDGSSAPAPKSEEGPGEEQAPGRLFAC